MAQLALDVRSHAYKVVINMDLMSKQAEVTICPEYTMHNIWAKDGE